MKKIIRLRDLEEMVGSGRDVFNLPAGARLTPAARHFLRGLKAGRGIVSGTAEARSASTVAARPAPPSKVPGSSSPKSELEAFFNSPYAHELKEQMCDMGRRQWQREYVEGNGGNMAIRVGADLAICTPTMASKGWLKPEDMCLVDFEGNQLLGSSRRTSEILMHVQIMKRQPQAVATCHCHPPFATAFAVVGEVPPTSILPEYELSCSVGLAPYRTPGTPEMGRLVAELTDKHDTILMANHGVVTWSHNSLEEAYWRMEIIEAYCRTIVAAGRLGKPINTFNGPQMTELLKIKRNLGYVDSRFSSKKYKV